jgi:hypothetical protein
MIALPILCIALLIYQTIRSYKASQVRRERHALVISGRRATDLEQWASIDPE